MKRIKYKTIKELIPYDKCIVDILPYLKTQFKFEEFVEQFLLEFNNAKKGMINDIGISRVKWWLRNYYLPKVAHKCKVYSFSKDKAPLWYAHPIAKISR